MRVLSILENRRAISTEKGLGAIIFISYWIRYQNSSSSKLRPQSTKGTTRISPKALSCLIFLQDYCTKSSPSPSITPFNIFFLSLPFFRILLKAMPTRTGISLGLLQIHSKYFPAMMSGSQCPLPARSPSERAMLSYHSSVPSPGNKLRTPPPSIIKADYIQLTVGTLFKEQAPIESPIMIPNIAPNARSQMPVLPKLGHLQKLVNFLTVSKGSYLHECKTVFKGSKLRLRVIDCDLGLMCPSLLLELQSVERAEQTWGSGIKSMENGGSAMASSTICMESTESLRVEKSKAEYS